MKEGSQYASPVFKKRFARRKTTHRPFTFARNFETEETSPAKNSIVSQVGDRGVVITSPVQLSEGNEGLTISEIVRQSPVPVLISHSTPKEKQKEQKSEYEEDDEANTSLLRRSFRSREPSESFLSRRQYPHGTPQHAKSHHPPDEHYIGSKNTSNIDAEVSLTDEDGQTRGKRKGTSASLSSSKQRLQARVGQKHLDSRTSAIDETQACDGNQSVDSSSKTKVAPAKRSSNRKTKQALSNTTSNRKERGQTVLDKTPSPLPSPKEAVKSPKDKTKKSTLSSHSKRNKNERTPAGSSKSEKENEVDSVSLSDGKKKKSVSKKTLQPTADGEKNETLAVRSVGKRLRQSRNTPVSSENEDLDFQEDGGSSASDSSRKRSSSVERKQKTHPQREKETRPFHKNKQTTADPPSMQGKRSETDKSSSTSRRRKQRLMSDSSTNSENDSDLERSTLAPEGADQSQEDTSVISSSAKKRKASVTDRSLHLGRSSRLSAIMEKETENKSDNSHENDNAVDIQNRETMGKKPRTVTMSSSSASALRRKKKILLDENDDDETAGPSPEKRARTSQVKKTKMSVVQNQSVTQGNDLSSSLSNTESRRNKASLGMSSDSQSAQKNKRKNTKITNESQNASLVSRKVVPGGLDERASAFGSRIKQITQTSKPTSPSRRITSNGCRSPEKIAWKISRQMDTSLKPKRFRRNLLQSSVYDDDSFGERDVDDAVLPAVKGKAVSGRGFSRKRSDGSDEGREGPSRRHSVMTELAVIINMLEDTEDDIMEEPTMSQQCQNAVHKTFTFTKKQLRETDSQVKEIAALELDVNKLKHVCKAMSSESKEKLQEKFILQKELQSLRNQGIDADMMRIDQWLQDFKLLRQCQS